MRRKTAIIITVIFIIILVLLTLTVYSFYVFVNEQDSYDINSTFTIANWNMQTFGDKKSSDGNLMGIYADAISHYDIIVLQEIRDKDASGFYKLCGMLPEYSCNISSRAGRTSSKEQYGIIYLKRFNLEKVVDYNPDTDDRWERPPFRADFSLDNYSFTVYTIHTKPNDTEREISSLESLIDSETNHKNIYVLGDMNADCSYYNPHKENIFHSWHWIIQDNDDTTTGPSDCAYDRIILNDDAYNEFLDYGIYRDSIDTQVSDHYPVWVRLRSYDYYKDKSFDAFLKSIV